MAGLHWTQGSPSQIAARLARIADAAQGVTNAVATDEASRGESRMKESAPWTDRTGEARSGLFGEAEPYGGGAFIHLGGTAPHQPFLELGTRYMAPRSIIVPTADETHIQATNQLSRALMELLA